MANISYTGKRGEIKRLGNLDPNDATAGSVVISTQTGGLFDATAFGIFSDSNITSITLTAAKFSSINTGEISAMDRVGAVNATANQAASIDLLLNTGQSTTSIGSLGAVTLNAANLADVNAEINANASIATTRTIAATASVGAITLNSNGNLASTVLDLNTTRLNVGNVAINAIGARAFAKADVSTQGALLEGPTPSVQGGSIGNVSLTARGMAAFARSDEIATIGQTSLSTGGNIGNISLTASGINAEASVLKMSAMEGNLGTVSVVASAEFAIASLIEAEAIHGNIGNLTLNATGVESVARISNMIATSKLDVTGTTARAIGGNVGNISVGTTAQSAAAVVNVISNGVMALENETYLSAGNIGNTTVNATGDFSETNLTMRANAGGNIGNITFTGSGSFSQDHRILASTQFGNMGNISATLSGVSTKLSLNLNAGAGVDESVVRRGGNIGTVALNANGTNTNLATIINADFQPNDDVAGKIGNITLAASGAYAVNDSTLNAGGQIGTVTATVSGQNAIQSSTIGSVNGGVGAISATASGVSATSTLTIAANNGDVGAITARASALFAETDITISASRSLGAVTAAASAVNASADVTATLNAKTSNGVLVNGRVGAVTATASGALSESNVFLNVNGVMLDTDTSIDAVNVVKVGNLSTTASASASSTALNVIALDGVDIGTVTARATGAQTAQKVDVSTDAGNIGNVSVSNTGYKSESEVDISALNRGGVGGVGGRIGNVILESKGTAAVMGADLEADASIGNLTVTTDGAGVFTETITAPEFEALVNVTLNKGATLGNTILNVKGSEASGEISIDGFAGAKVGNLALNLQTGATASLGDAKLSVLLEGTDTNLSSIGNTTILVNNANSSNNNAVFEFDVDKGRVGDITATVTGGLTSNVTVFGRQLNADTAGAGGTLGNVTLTNTAEAGGISFNVSVQKTVGNIIVNATGERSAYEVRVADADVSVGNITVTISKETGGPVTPLDIVNQFSTENLVFPAGSVELELANTAVVGDIKVSGGSVASVAGLGYFDVIDELGDGITANSVKSVDFSGFEGGAAIILGGVLSVATTNSALAYTTILGAKSSNFIVGTQANDRIIVAGGGNGIDSLTGGGGNDSFQFNRVVSGGLQDEITDFVVNQDQILINFSGLPTRLTGIYPARAETILEADDFNVGAAVGTTAQFIFNTDGTDGFLTYDADGTGSAAAINIVQLTGVTTLSASDISIIA